MNLENRKQALLDARAALGEQSAPTDGRAGAYERLRLLFDEGSFAETDEFVSVQNGEITPEGVVTGYGAIDGRLVFAFAQDRARDKGALGLRGAQKIAALYQSAKQNGAPVVGIFDSDGLRLNEGTDALAACSVLLKAAADAKHKIPTLSLITGPCTGANAAFALEADVVMMAGEHASLALSPVSVLTAAGAAEDAGSPAANARLGLAHLTAETEQEGLNTLRSLLAYLPSNKKDKAPVLKTNDSPERALPELVGAGASYNMKDLIAHIADSGSFCELSADYAPGIFTGFALIAGRSCGIVANNPQVNGGALHTAGAQKAADFITFCNAFSLPILTLVDSVGYDAADEATAAAAAKAVSNLAASYAAATTARVTVVVGKAVGSVFSVLGAKALGADFVLALPCAQIGVMDTDAAINFLWNDALREADNAETARAELKEQWEAEISTPLNAARNGHIDFICDEQELRARIASAFSMLAQKRHFADFL